MAAPSIVNHPQDVLALGQSATLMVDVVGTPQLTYQWFRNGIEVPNSNNPLLGVPADQLGEYHVEVSNDYGTATSLPARVRGLSTFAVNQVPQHNAQGFTLTLEPPAGQQFTTADLDLLAVQGSTDLKTWQPLVNALRLQNGRIEIADPEAQTFLRRFYRFSFDPAAP